MGKTVPKRDLIAYCGLYCDDCVSRKGKIAELAEELRSELRREKFERTADVISAVPFFSGLKDYPVCYEVLGALTLCRCLKTCRDGGGPPFCEIRKCCRERDLRGCWQCGEFESCSKLDFLKPLHGTAHLVNLRKLKRQGEKAFITGKRHWRYRVKPTHDDRR
jgi:hypothetical protein